MNDSPKPDRSGSVEVGGTGARLPEPDFFIQDQVLGGGYIIGRENPKPDVPSVGVQACGLYTYGTLRDVLAASTTSSLTGQDGEAA